MTGRAVLLTAFTSPSILSLAVAFARSSIEGTLAAAIHGVGWTAAGVRPFIAWVRARTRARVRARARARARVRARARARVRVRARAWARVRARARARVRVRVRARPFIAWVRARARAIG